MTTISDKNAEELRDARRKKSLGELGELFAIKTLVDHEFDRIRNLNDTHANEPFADVICEKNGHRYVISVKARNKFQLNGKLNTRYNLGSNSYANARSAGEKYQARPYWMAIQFSEHHYSVFFGSLESLNGSKAIPIDRCQNGDFGEILVNMKRHYFDFDFYKNVRKRNRKPG